MPNGQLKAGMMEPSPSDPAARSAIFLREGEYWTITYEGTVFRLRDSKGLRYLAQLLRRPGAALTAAELAYPQQVGATMDPEQARSAVSKRIRAAVQKIERHHPALGYHLATAVKTGQSCIYQPDPTRPMVWTT